MRAFQPLCGGRGDLHLSDAPSARPPQVPLTVSPFANGLHNLYQWALLESRAPVRALSVGLSPEGALHALRRHGRFSACDFHILII